MLGSNLPLRALVVFEASARLGSFRAASDELGLTPSAVSHQVRALESGLGVELFERVGRGVTLSQDGRDLFAGIRDGFELLKRSVDAARRQRHGGRKLQVVRLQTPPSFASRWLLPRLPALLAEHPGIDIRVNADKDQRPNAPGVDLAIVYGDARTWGATATALLDETIQPLCAPALAAGITTPGDLLTRPLIGTRGNALSWRSWFRRQGIDFDRAGAAAMELDPSDVAIEAAVGGLGIVLESNVLTENEIATGRLMAPLPSQAVTGPGYWLLPSPAGGGAVGAAPVRAWLLDAASPVDVVR